jgi:hypothetical protein
MSRPMVGSVDSVGYVRKSDAVYGWVEADGNVLRGRERSQGGTLAGKVTLTGEIFDVRGIQVGRVIGVSHGLTIGGANWQAYRGTSMVGHVMACDGAAQAAGGALLLLFE